MGSGGKGYLILTAVSLFSALLICGTGGFSGADKWERYETVSPKPAAAAPPVAEAAEPVPLQFQFLPWSRDFLYANNVPVHGLALGYSQPQREIEGVSLAFIHAFNAKKTGFSMSVIEMSGESNGFAMFLAGGMIHNNGCSLGVWNMTENNRGVQLGLLNQAEKDILIEYDMKPVDTAGKFGVQAGLINYSDAPGIQFGLWNTNPNSLIKHFPLFNICL